MLFGAYQLGVHRAPNIIMIMTWEMAFDTLSIQDNLYEQRLQKLSEPSESFFTLNFFSKSLIICIILILALS